VVHLLSTKYHWCDCINPWSSWLCSVYVRAVFLLYDYSPQVLEAPWLCSGGILAPHIIGYCRWFTDRCTVWVVRVSTRIFYGRMGALCLVSVNVFEGNIMCECVLEVRVLSFCLRYCPEVWVLWVLLVLMCFGVMIVMLLSWMCYEMMSDEHSVSVCPARVIDLYFDSANVLLGMTVLHISMNVG
jgi:hypothetical protein